MTRHRLLTTSVAVLATALTAVAVPAMAGPPPGEITEFTVPTATGQLMGIAGGTDGNVWFVETSAKKIGRVTPAGAFQEFPIPNNNDAWMITAGPDGNMWFTQPGANQIGRVTSDGVFDEFAIPTPASLPYGIAAGPDGNVWFVENSANKIGRITPAGVVTEFDIPTPASNAYNIVTGDDGNLWFTENGANTIGRISPTGTIHEFEVPTTSSLPDGITAGPDGNVWFTEFSGNKVGRITPDGSFTEFSVPTAFAGPQGIATGADGNLWITEYAASKVAQVTPEGVMVEFPVPNGAGSFPGVMSTGPDGNMWFTEKNSHKVLCWSPRVVRPVLTQALLRACYQEGRDLSNVNELLAIAVAVGLDERSARSAILGASARAELVRRSEEAARAGVFGVPTFVVDSQSGPRLFFGQDRLPFVEEALHHHPLAPPPAPETMVATREARQSLSLPPANVARRVTFYYDFSSPFSYLASTQIEGIAARHGAVVDWHPILLGGVFKSLGTPLVPINSYGEAKRRHARDDLNRWAHHYDVALHWPSRFPMVTVTALRLALLAEERRAALSHALFRAFWVQDGDLNDPQTLEAALREVGLDAALLERASEPAVKQRLLSNTEAALHAGIYGAPSFVVEQHHGAPQLFFGQDRLAFVEQALHRGTTREAG